MSVRAEWESTAGFEIAVVAAGTEVGGYATQKMAVVFGGRSGGCLVVEGSQDELLMFANRVRSEIVTQTEAMVQQVRTITRGEYKKLREKGDAGPVADLLPMTQLTYRDKGIEATHWILEPHRGAPRMVPVNLESDEEGG